MPGGRLDERTKSKSLSPHEEEEVRLTRTNERPTNVSLQERENDLDDSLNLPQPESVDSGG